MKTINRIITAAALVTFASFANAQTEVPNEFVATEPAVASEVNANFSALITAIDNLGTRVTALEAGGGTTVSNDVNGRSYAVVEFGRLIEKQTDGSNTNFLDNLWGNDISITFVSASTAELTYTAEEAELLHSQNLIPQDGDIQEFLLQTETSFSQFPETVTTPIVLTYSQSGSIVSLDTSDEGDGSDITSLRVSPDGSTFIAIEMSASSVETEVNILIGVEVTD